MPQFRARRKFRLRVECPKARSGPWTAASGCRTLPRPMCLCTLCADRFLQCLLGASALPDYCRARRVRLPARLARRGWAGSVKWWGDTLRRLPDRLRAQVEWEQLAVPELATPSGYLHLLAAAGGKGPPPDGPTGVLAGVLRFLLDSPALFREVYSRHRRREPNVWRAARATAGLPLPEPATAEARVTSTLAKLYREHTGNRAHCEVAVHRVPGAVYVSARPRGERTGLPAAQTFAELVYFPADGTVLLRCPWPDDTRAREVMRCVFEAALGAPLGKVRPGFALDRLREPFRPLPDADDVLSARLTALHLRYPGRLGRREVRLRALPSDSPAAVEEMLRAHGGRHLDELRVSHAALLVRVRLEGCEKDRLVRLWPNRCDAGEGPFRARVLASLRSWGL